MCRGIGVKGPLKPNIPALSLSRRLLARANIGSQLQSETALTQLGRATSTSESVSSVGSAWTPSGGHSRKSRGSGPSTQLGAMASSPPYCTASSRLGWAGRRFEQCRRSCGAPSEILTELVRVPPEVGHHCPPRGLEPRDYLTSPHGGKCRILRHHAPPVKPPVSAGLPPEELGHGPTSIRRSSPPRLWFPGRQVSTRSGSSHSIRVDGSA